jgi:arylformamidase
MQFFDNPNRLFRSSWFLIVLWFMWPLSYAGSICDRINEYRSAQQAEEIEDRELSNRVSLPVGVHLLRDMAYGKDGRQRMDIYLPRHAEGVPVIFMVHGGSWRRGDKGSKTVVEKR